MMKKDRLIWVDIAKGLGIILVVYGHVIDGMVEADIDVSPMLHYYSQSMLGAVRMPLFFFLSGMFAQQSLNKRGGRRFLGVKLQALVYPYIVWSLLKGGLEVLFADYTNSPISAVELLRFIYIPRGHLWFLYAMLITFIVFVFLSKTRKHSLLIMLVVALCLYVYRIRVPVFALYKFSAYFIYFVLGISYTLFELDWQIEKFASPVWSATAFLTFLGMGILLFSRSGDLLSGVELVYAITGLLFFILLSQTLSGKLRFLEVLGMQALEIYLAHTIIASGIRIILDKFLSIELASLHLIAGLLAGLIVPILLYRVGVRLNFPYLFELPRESHSRQTA